MKCRPTHWALVRTRASALAAVTAGLLVLGAAPAGAQIEIGPVQTVTSSQGLTGVACTDATDCLAVGGGLPPTPSSPEPGALVPVSDGVAGAAQDVAGTNGLNGIACAPVGDCLAGGAVTADGGMTFGGGFVPISGGQPGAAEPVSGLANVLSVACPGSGDCVAVGGSSVVSVTNGTPGPPQNIVGTQFLSGVACPTATQCLAVGINRASNGVVVPIVSGTAGSPLPPLTNVVELYAIACANSTDCFGVGRGFSGDGVVVPITGGAVGSVQDVTGSTGLTGIACPTSTECVAVGYIQGSGAMQPEGVMVPITGGVAGSVQQVSGSFPSAFDQIGCATSSECLAVGVTVGPGASSEGGAVTQVLVGAPLGAPSVTIAAPEANLSYPLDDQAHPVYSFSCQAAFAGYLASPGGCVATLNGSVVADGQPIDTSQAGTFTLMVTATQADGQQVTATGTFTVSKGNDAIYFPPLGPFPYHHAAVPLDAIAVSGSPVFYSVVSGPCTVSGSTLTFTGSGQCVVMAEQPGTANYLAASITSTITIEPPAPPRCASLSVDVPSGDFATISLGCADAYGDPGDPLSIAVTSLPSHGSLTALDRSTGTVTYTPASGYEGPDSFAFDATNAQGVATPAKILINVMTTPATVDGPVVSGTAEVAHELKCSIGTWSGTKPLTYSYVWERDRKPLTGRTRATYAVGAADAGHSLTCAVTATNGVGSATALSAPVHIPVPSNAFSLGKLSVRRGGSLAVQLIAPGPGRFTAVASVGIRPGKRAYGSGGASVKRKGDVTLTIHPGKRVEHEVREGTRLRVTVSVTFTPTDGKRHTKTAELTA